MGSIINDVQVGKDTRIDICSQSHGRKRVPMADTLSFTPAKAVALVAEFDNRYPVMAYETYEGVDVAFEVIQADQTEMDAMVMDVDTNEAIQQNDPAQHQPVTVFANYTGHNTGYKYAAEYAEGLHVAARPSTHALKDATKIPYSFKGTRYIRVAGKTGSKCAIQYDRFVNAAVYTTPDDVTVLTPFTTGGMRAIASPVPLTGATGTLTVGTNATNYIQAKRNGKVMTYGTPGNGDFTINANLITFNTALASGDVVELWYVAG